MGLTMTSSCLFVMECVLYPGNFLGGWITSLIFYTRGLYSHLPLSIYACTVNTYKHHAQCITDSEHYNVDYIMFFIFCVNFYKFREEQNQQILLYSQSITIFSVVFYSQCLTVKNC